MNTRRNFLNWMATLEDPPTSEISRATFLNIHEKKYVFDVLEKLQNVNGNPRAMLLDYYHLEQQRYHIFESHTLDERLAVNRLASAIAFCAKSDDKKRKGRFRMNLSISNYVAESAFFWDVDDIANIEPKTTHYLFVPSFLPIAPKEICLTGLQALLLDIMSYENEFTYQEFFGLVKETLDLPPEQLDSALLEFMEKQILYFGTILALD